MKILWLILFKLLNKKKKTLQHTLECGAVTYTSRSSEFSTTREQSSLTDASMGALWREYHTVWVEQQWIWRGEDNGPRRLPVRGEGQLVHSASVDGLHVDRLRLQEVLYSHSAQLITCGEETAVNQNPTDTDSWKSVLLNTWMECLTDDNDIFLVWVPSHSAGGGVGGIHV